jgi:putative sterol carrier protein
MAPPYGTDEWEAIYREILQKRKRIASKPYIAGTPEWADAYQQVVQEDEEYKRLARGWEGTVVLHTIAEPEAGIDHDVYILLDLWHGECRKVRLVPAEAGEAADYVISGSYSTWKLVGNGSLRTDKALMQGKLKLKGDLATLTRYRMAAERLGKLSAHLNGRSLEDLLPEEARELQALYREFLDRLM